MTFGISIMALVALGLALLAALAVATVLFAARRSIIPFQQIKSVAATLLWIVPALAVVVYVGRRWDSHHFDGNLSHPSFTSIRNELRSTVREAHEAWREASAEAREALREVRTELRSITHDEEDCETTATPECHAEMTAEIEQTAPLAEAESLGFSTVLAPEAPATPVAAQPESEPARHRALVHIRFPAGDRVLTVAETRSGAPDWAGKDPVPGDRGILVSLSSQRFATLQEAEQDVSSRAAEYVKKFYNKEYPLPGDWSVPVAVIEQNAVHELVGEKFEKDFGNGIPEPMYRAHLQLELNSALRNALHDSWHDQIVTHRLTMLGSMLGLVTLMLATSAGYFRLDDLTGGQYRRRLKFAAASLIAAGSLVALVVA
jgi:hypothetical protein